MIVEAWWVQNPVREAEGLETQERGWLEFKGSQSAVEPGLADVAYEVQRLSGAKCPLAFLFYSCLQLIG